MRRSVLSVRRAEDDATASKDAVDPIALAVSLRKHLPENYRIFDETITHTRAVQQHLRPSDDGSYYYVPGGLGQGIGVALGGKLASPETFTVMTVGDGAFLYNPIVQALSASREHDLPILIVVFNNKQYLSMKHNHLRFYPDGISVQNNLFHGVDLSGQPALERFAEPFGFAGIYVDTMEELDAAVASAVHNVRNGKTTILNVHVAK